MKFKTIILLIFITSIIFRISALSIPQDMWHDASFTYLFANKDVTYINSANDVHPPLFYLLMKIWLYVSDNEIWIRCFSLLFFVLSFWMFNKFLKDNYNDNVTAKKVTEEF